MTTTQPDSMTKDEGLRAALAAAYEQGATDVHHEWKRAWYQGEGPPRGDPEFYEAASDYAASVDLPTPAEAEAEPVAGDALDWLKVAKLAGEHGIRYRTNRALEQFLAAISSKPTPVEAGALREAEQWLRACSEWLLLNDLDMQMPSGVLDTDPLDIANRLAALSQPVQPEVGELERAYGAIRWIYVNGMQPDHSRPKAVSDVCNEAFASYRIAQDGMPDPRAEGMGSKRQPGGSESGGEEA